MFPRESANGWESLPSVGKEGGEGGPGHGVPPSVPATPGKQGESQHRSFPFKVISG